MQSCLRLILACAVFPLAASAQTILPDAPPADRSGFRATEFWAGFSNRSPKWGVLGNRPGMSFGLAAARSTWRLKTTAGYALDYTVDFIPAALSSPPLGHEAETAAMNNHAMDQTECLMSCRFPTGSAFGAGVSPVGFTAVYRRDRMVQPRLGFAGGVLLFDRAVPTIISTRFNFTASIEAGAQILNHNGDGVLLVYRFHHLSNAGTGYDNSALASHVISLGARFRSRGR